MLKSIFGHSITRVAKLIYIEEKTNLNGLSKPVFEHITKHQEFSVFQFINKQRCFRHHQQKSVCLFDEYFFSGARKIHQIWFTLYIGISYFLRFRATLSTNKKDMSISSQNFEIGIILDMSSRLYHLINM